jgi:hypothetical protein
MKRINPMDDSMKKQIERENRREVRRMGAGDWSLILGAAVLVAAVLGFIYLSDETGVSGDANQLEPAAGAAVAPAPAYDSIPDNTADDTAPSGRPVP